VLLLRLFYARWRTTFKLAVSVEGLIAFFGTVTAIPPGTYTKTKMGMNVFKDGQVTWQTL
jgi:hypothetical protein